MLEFVEISDRRALENKKNRVNIVITGHVDSGKSTLLGHVMVLTENVVPVLTVDR